MKKLLFISPPLHVKLNDTMTTGIVFMPFVLADAVGIARSLSYDVKVFDCFAENPRSKTVHQEFGEMIIGVGPSALLQTLGSSINNYSDIFVFANHISNHRSVREICALLVEAGARTHVIENSEAVTAYSLMAVADELTEVGVNNLFINDVEKSFAGYVNENSEVSNGRFESRYLNDKAKLVDHEVSGSYMPAWDLFPLAAYWQLGFGHGPISSAKYLPLLTSKGCPFPCEFCVIPELTGRRWRFRTPGGIFEDMKHFYETLGVTEFHIEDVNPTINCPRLVELGDLVAASAFKNIFTWKLVSGTKLETIRNQDALVRMAAGGLNYVSFSPESGSERVRSSIGKPFNITHAKNFLGWAKLTQIHTQACFVLGFPAERLIDKFKSLLLVMKMTWWGVDEIAVFIITPIPGSSLYDKENISGYGGNDNFSFSPSWRKDYVMLAATRVALYVAFLLTKSVKSPFKLAKSALKVLKPISSTSSLKMEMAPVRSRFFKGLNTQND